MNSGRVPGEGALTALLGALTAITALSIDMSLPAMPRLQEAFRAEAGTVQLTLSLFLIGFAVGQVFCGPLSDRVGRRPVLLAGLGVFIVAGLACAASTSLALLVGGRLVQGAGASVGPTLARAIVRDRFEGIHSAAVLSRITQVMIVAPLLAPTIGGYLLVALGWRAIFVTLALAGTLLASVCWQALPETLAVRNPHAGRPGHIGEALRSILAHRPSFAYSATTWLGFAGLFAYVSGSPFVFINGFGVSARAFGGVFALTAASLVVGATLNRRLLRRLPSEAIVRRVVFLLAGSGGVLFLLVWSGVGTPAAVLLPMMVFLFSLGLIQPNATALAMAPHGRLAGVASAVLGSLQTACGAITGYLANALYDGTPRALAATVGVCGLLAFTAARLASWGGRIRNEGVLTTESEG